MKFSKKPLVAAIATMLALPVAFAGTLEFRKTEPTLKVALIAQTGNTPSSGTTPPSNAGTSESTTAKLGMSATALPFPATKVGTSASPLSVIVNNSGTGPLTLQGISMVDGAADFNQSNNCGNSLTAGGSCTVNVLFTPSVKGARTGNVGIVSNVGTYGIALSGTGLQAVGELTADTVANFGSVAMGAPVTRNFTFRNTGDDAATGAYAAVSGTGLSITANTCGTQAQPVSIGAGLSCTIAVQYAPPAPGTLTGSLAVTSSAAGSPNSLALTGTGQYSSNNYALQFNGTNGSTSIADTGTGSAWSSTGSPAITTAIYREGTGALNLNGVNQAISGPYIPFPGDFSAGVWIRPTARTGGNTAIMGQWRQTPGQGAWLLNLDSAGKLGLTWGPYSEYSNMMASSAAVPLNQWSHVGVTRVGSAIKIYINGTVVASGTNAGAVSTASVPFSLGSYFTSGGGLSAGYYFAGQMDDARINVGNGTLSYNSVTSTLSAPASADFGTVSVGDTSTKSIAVTNSGSAPALVSSVTTGGEFSVVDASACTAATLAPGASCNISVKFTPAAVGVRTPGTLTVTSDASNASFGVSLTGTGSGILTALKVLGESGTVVDSMGGTLTGAGAPAPSVTSANPIDGAGSINFPAKGSYLTTSSSTRYAFGASDFTMEVWVRPTTNVQTAALSNYPGGAFTSSSWSLVTSHQYFNSKVAFLAYNMSSSSYVLLSKTTLPINTWSHVAVTRAGTTMTLYINGVAESTATVPAAAGLDAGLTTARQLGIGQVEGNNGYGFAGQMDDLRITRGQAIYTGNFTPPTNMQ